MGAVKNHPRSAGNDTGRRIQTGNGGHTKTKAAMGFIMQCTHRNIRRVSPPSGLVIADVIGHDGLNRTSNSLINSNHRCGVGLGSRARVQGNRIVVCIVLHDGAIRTALLQLNGDVCAAVTPTPEAVFAKYESSPATGSTGAEKTILTLDAVGHWSRLKRTVSAREVTFCYQISCCHAAQFNGCIRSTAINSDVATRLQHFTVKGNGVRCHRCRAHAKSQNQSCADFSKFHSLISQ